jgi:hypothetical protein
MTVAMRLARLATLTVAVVVLVAAESCKHGSSSSPDASAEPTIDDSKCATCVALHDKAHFYFIGQYFDDKCSQPVLHADIGSCARVRASGTVTATFMQELDPHPQFDRAQVTLSRQVTPEEAEHLHQKEGLNCSAYTPVGYNLVPTGCDGKKVCWGADGKLACGGCRTIGEEGCPDYDKSRVYVLFTESPPAAQQDQ